MELSLWFSVFALIIALFALVGVIRLNLSVRKMRADRVRTGSAAIEESTSHNDGPIVVIYNPSKNVDFRSLSETLNSVVRAANCPEPIWIATTVDEHGEEQARKALSLSPSLVIVAGGDGTVRLVAGQLAGSGVPLGIFPIGTGNLFARNVGLPLHDWQRMAEVAVTGRNRRIDIGWLSAPVYDAPETDSAEIKQRRLWNRRSKKQDTGSTAQIFQGTTPFLVISGIGFDAHVMEAANPELKSAFGWSAYILAGMQHLRDRKVKATISTNDEDNRLDIEARSIMFANCGELAGGFVLAPHARPDDGWLDVTVVDTKGGLIGWTDLVRRVSLQSIGVSHAPSSRVMPEAGSLNIRRSRTMTVQTEELEQVEADGDVVGVAKEVTAWIDSGALSIRVP